MAVMAIAMAMAVMAIAMASDGHYGSGTPSRNAERFRGGFTALRARPPRNWFCYAMVATAMACLCEVNAFAV